MKSLGTYLGKVIIKENYLRIDNTYKILINGELEQFGETSILINNRILQIGKINFFDNLDQIEEWDKLNWADLVELKKHYNNEFNKLMNMFEHLAKFDFENNFISKYIYKFLREVVYKFVKLQILQLYTFERSGE